MRIHESELALAVLVSAALFACAYTASAYWAAAFVREWEGRLWWPSTPGGSFYPWPHPPLGIQGMMTSQLGELDSWFYSHVIQSGVLLFLTLLLWGLVAWNIWKLIRYQRFFKKDPRPEIVSSEFRRLS